MIYCTSLTSIKHCGTEAEWNAISKGESRDEDIGDYTNKFNYEAE
jgi:hypothetical protein